MRAVLAVLIGSSLFLGGTLHSQQVSPIPHGERIRVTAPECRAQRLVTKFEVYGSGALRLPKRSCPLEFVTRIDVSRGRKSRVLDGMAIGLVSGILVGAGYGVVYCFIDGCNVAYTVIAGSLGMLLGAPPGLALGLIGGTVATLAVPVEDWEEVPLDDQRFSFALGLSLKL
jgi:hypothetical protein